MLDISGISTPCFCGLTTQIHLVGKDIDDEATTMRLANLYLKDNSLQPFHDLQIKKTYVIDNRFFSNIIVKNYRLWQTGETISGITRPARSDVHEHGIEITVDFNDRYVFNESKTYHTDENTAITIIQAGMNETDIIVNHIARAIQ